MENTLGVPLTGGSRGDTGEGDGKLEVTVGMALAASCLMSLTFAENGREGTLRCFLIGCGGPVPTCKGRIWGSCPAVFPALGWGQAAQLGALEVEEAMMKVVGFRHHVWPLGHIYCSQEGSQRSNKSGTIYLEGCYNHPRPDLVVLSAEQG